jgi:hypothetical protein
MIFYLSILAQSQNQKPDPEIPDTTTEARIISTVSPGNRERRAPKTRANYFLEWRLLT